MGFLRLAICHWITTLNNTNKQTMQADAGQTVQIFTDHVKSDKWIGHEAQMAQACFTTILGPTGSTVTVNRGNAWKRKHNMGMVYAE